MRKYRNVVTIAENAHLHGIWSKMKSRCFKPENPRYHQYGGRGITMCDEWANDFDAFADWAHENGYVIGLTIERNDVNGNYEPENCSWITRKAQAKNKRDALYVEYKGVTKRLQDWCEELGISYDTTHDRIYKRGWDVDRAFETPSQQANSFSKLCREHGMNPATVHDRITKFGWTLEEALSIPAGKRGCSNLRAR